MMRIQVSVGHFITAKSKRLWMSITFYLPASWRLKDSIMNLY
nr:hypothetical protein Iba_chr02fCG13370 [Ipomoea batatas]